MSKRALYVTHNNFLDIMLLMPVNDRIQEKNDRKLTIFTLAHFSERIFKI